jgi:hypothetical protein
LPIAAVEIAMPADPTAQRARCVAATLAELDLPDLRHAAAREAGVPGEEREEHRDRRHVREAEPGSRAGVQAGRGRGDGRDARRHRRGDYERPADRVRGAEPARERAALGVAHGAQRRGAEEEEVGGPRPAAAQIRPRADRDEREDRHEPGRARPPEPPGRALAGAKDRGDRRCGREEGDHDGAVRGGLALERERAEQREADHDAERDDRERRRLRAGRSRRARRAQVRRGEDGRDGRPAECDEPRVESGDRQARGREREAEAQDAERAEDDAGAERRSRYRPALDSVIHGAHV